MIKIWIGRRETDLLTYPSEYFDFSITYYGSNKNNNYSYDVNKRTCLKYDINFFMFVIQKITEITNGYNYSLFFYNARLAQKLIKYDNKILGHIKYCNSFELLRWFNNKSYTRMWLSNYVSVPPFLLLSKHDCTIEFLSKSFPTIDKFALQLNYSSGGTGTYILEKETASKTYNLLSDTIPYLVSPYIERSFSACCHLLITENNYVLFPIGMQYLKEAVLYRGTTYILPDDLRKEMPHIIDFIDKIAILLSRCGYRGICGFDFLVTNKDIYMLEINPRYMGSTFVINYALNKNGFPTIFELNQMAFENNKKLIQLKKDLFDLRMPYRCNNVYEGEVFDAIPSDKYLIYNDGYSKSIPCEKNAYLYAYIELL